MQRPLYMQESWFLRLREEVAKRPDGVAGVTRWIEECGVGKISRPALSMILNGTYPAGVARIGAKLAALFARRTCPYLGEEVSFDYCVQVTSGPAPTYDPSLLENRTHCNRCPLDPRKLAGAA